VLFYRAAVDLSRSTLNYVAGIVRRHRKAIASTWRLLTPGRQALVVLVHLRKGETFAEAGAGFEVSTSTAWRYVEEVVALLSARSPKLTQALAKATKDLETPPQAALQPQQSRPPRQGHRRPAELRDHPRMKKGQCNLLRGQLRIGCADAAAGSPVA
jgi:hypothetical protein